MSQDTTTGANALMPYRREPVWADARQHYRAIARHGEYLLYRTRGGWLVQGHQWHGHRDISREYASHESSGRGKSPDEAIENWARRAIAIGRTGLGGLTADEAWAIAADLGQQVEAALEALADPDEMAEVTVSVSAMDGQAQYSAEARFGPWRANVYHDCAPETPCSTVAAVLQKKLRDEMPLAASARIVVGEDDIPTDAARVVEVDRILRAGSGTLYRRHDGAPVEVTGVEVVNIPTHPSMSGGGTHYWYTIGGQRVHATDVRRLYR